jgi:hypothetical protein
VSERARLCARPGCSQPATCTFSYDYASRTVWLYDLAEHDLGRYDMCLPHGDGLKAPIGWALDDRRSPILALRRDNIAS